MSSKVLFAMLSTMIILLHTSKTMRDDISVHAPISRPVLLQQAAELAGHVSSLSNEHIQSCMAVSAALAEKTHQTFVDWSPSPSSNSAVDSFVGDIYSGLQAGKWTHDDALFAQDHLRILSGLYGILRPLDDVRSYRLEMGYKLPGVHYKNLYTFWGNSVAKQLPESGPILNLTAVEYSKVVMPYIDTNRVITPVFMTVSPKTGEPTFVTVHAKIARGSFANWIIKNRVTAPGKIVSFNDLGYTFDQQLSTPDRPVFVCQQFGGLGLSVRLVKS